MSRHCTMRRRGAIGAAVQSTDRRGFTLVELLVVITIIGILIGLLASAAALVLGAGKEARIISEIAQLDTAMKAYKEKYGSYPPSDLSNLGSTTSPQYIALAQHLSKAFGRCNVANEIAAINAYGMTTPAQALTFFLNGYSSDAERPVSGLTPANQLAPIYPFDKSRFAAVSGSAVPIYCPADTPGVPYVYFAAQNYVSHSASSGPGIATGTGQGYCRPYFIDSPPTGATGANLYVNPSSFQIISAGLDSDYGGTSGATAIYYPSGTNSQPGDKDNLTNFSSKNLGAAAQN